MNRSIQPIIIKGCPPNIDAIRAVFPLPKGVIFTYGSMIYVPSGDKLSSELIAHESVHTTQQGDNPDKWWDRYLIDPEWRLEQELEAHRVEWRVYCKNSYGREKRARFMFEISKRLASPMYGNLLSIQEAIRLIKR